MQSMLYRIVTAETMLQLASPGGNDQTSVEKSPHKAEQVTIEGCLLCDWVNSSPRRPIPRGL